MPPVFGPSSPSKARLKSCAATSGSAVRPSQIAKSETSGPSRSSSTITSPAAPLQRAHRLVDLGLRSDRRRRPFLRRARPPSRRTAAARSASRAAVGTPAAPSTSLANAFEPSIRAAAALGPKTRKPNRRSTSASPSTSGSSGPDHDEVDLERARRARAGPPRRPAGSGDSRPRRRFRGFRARRAAPSAPATARASRQAHARDRPNRRRGLAPVESSERARRRPGGYPRRRGRGGRDAVARRVTSMRGEPTTPNAIGALFSEDAAYRYPPVGRGRGDRPRPCCHRRELARGAGRAASHGTRSTTRGQSLASAPSQSA